LKPGRDLMSKRSQMQWLALLAVAVLLPTVSLLWFMIRVIDNERLVVRQKLAALYQDKLTDATARTESLFAARLAGLDKLKPATNPYALLRRLLSDGQVQGVVVWNEDGSMLYPSSSQAPGSDLASAKPLAAAWQLEFAGGQYAQAAELYQAFTSDEDPRLAIAALAGRSRCLARLGRLNEAIDECQKAAFPTASNTRDPDLRLAIENARLYLLSLLAQPGQRQAHAELLQRTAAELAADLFNPNVNPLGWSANRNLFMANKILDALRGTGSDADRKIAQQLEPLAAAEALSIAAAETAEPLAGPFDAFFRMELDGKPVYGLRHRVGSATVLVLLTEAGMRSMLAGYHNTFAGSEAAYRILTATGAWVDGTAQPKGQAFAEAPLPGGFPGWKVELYFQGSDVFEKAAHRQIAVYIWTGALVIVLILAAGGFAMRAVGRQIRLNRMKNDFIATVSHELKTPLASMRVLVDTLLEGNVRDDAQAHEYLRLTAKENERLSRMIDNFLTFSRMERNKKAFHLTETAPAAIVHDAVESVKTKLNSHNCRLSIDLPESLPEIHADHDAIVTVLVNLLDNACKYSLENKQTSLKVFADDGFLCFAVSDNGIGIGRRHLRRIFDSFYQVDSSLARKAEGCGLGLSIVKFIVDAHKGNVTVDSKPGKGSTFTVRLPVAGDNNDSA
jgi:signal transduction histidine kinase